MQDINTRYELRLAAMRIKPTMHTRAIRSFRALRGTRFWSM